MYLLKSCFKFFELNEFIYFIFEIGIHNLKRPHYVEKVLIYGFQLPLFLATKNPKGPAKGLFTQNFSLEKYPAQNNHSGKAKIISADSNLKYLQNHP